MSRKSIKRFNIKSLFTSDNKAYTGGKLDMNTLFGNDNSESTYDFDSSILLKNIHKKRKKVETTHNEIFRICCETIQNASDAGQTSMYHSVPNVAVDCPEYNPRKCAEHIIEKLKTKYIVAIIIDDNKMYISWDDIEEKINADASDCNK